MRIAFDGHIFAGENMTGIGWFGYYVMDSLRKYSDNTYRINVCRNRKETRKKVEHFSKKGFEICERKFPNRLFRFLYTLRGLPYSFLYGTDTDVTVFFNYVVPRGVKGKKIVFVHDMAYRAHPDTVRCLTKVNLKMNMKRSVLRADHIVTISKFSRREIAKYFHFLKNSISIIPCGVDHKVFHPNYEKREVRRVLEKYNITASYILYLGTIEPRKNLERLLYGYHEAAQKTPELPQLILAGGDGWRNRSIYAAVKKLRLDGKVRFLGYVDAMDRPLLLNGAWAFVFPSIYEGFGIPPLEAMACGVPVVTSNAASLPEVVGDAAVKVNPYSIREIAEAICLVCQDEDLRKELRERGIERAKKFKWEYAAEKLEKVIREVASVGEEM